MEDQFGPVPDGFDWVQDFDFGLDKGQNDVINEDPEEHES